MWSHDFRGRDAPHPVGNYAPDEAIAFKRAVCAACSLSPDKGTMYTMEISGVEKAKGSLCGLFDEASTSDVRYHQEWRTTTTDLLQWVGRLE